MDNYVMGEMLVSTDWVDQHKKDANVRLAEVDVDTKAYEEGHIEGAIGWNWQTQLCDTVKRELVPGPDLEKLLGESGITKDTIIILYGDNNNWFACWAFWQLKIYSHKDVRIMNGGRRKWIAEGRPLAGETPKYPHMMYRVAKPDFSSRAYINDVIKAVARANSRGNGWALVDVRSPDEFTGKLFSPPGLPETCQRGGHIPGARSIPWGMNCNDDGTFKSYAELKSLYENNGITSDKRVVTYCRIGERSSLTWFVLRYLLGYRNVINYDGSWTEWGNLVNADISRGENP